MNGTTARSSGVALPFTLLVLAVASLLLAIAWTEVSRESRIDRTAVAARRALYAAEGGALAALRNWRGAYNLLEPYPVDSLQIPMDFPTSWLAPPHGTGRYGGYLYRLNDELYMLGIVGRDASAASHTLGILLRLAPPSAGIRAALETGTSVRVSGSVAIDGADHVPPGWTSCGPNDSSGAGIAAESTTVLPERPGAVEGMPAILTTSSAEGRSGRWKTLRDTLASAPTHTLPGANLPLVQPSVVNGHCAITVAMNWGDALQPGAPCGRFYPVTHLTGDASLVNVSGQGALVVDGNLRVTGTVRWNGVIVVRESLDVNAAASAKIRIWGAVWAQQRATLAADSAGSSIDVLYSKCAITKALETVAAVVPVASRGWLEAF